MVALLGYRWLEQLKRLLPDSDHPAASQPTPFGLNRYVMLLLYVLHVVLTACDYMGWAALSSMLFRSEAFLWLCAPEEQATNENKGNIIGCAAQNSSVQQLFAWCYAAHFITTGLAGFLLDFAGPKVTALLGAVMGVFSWILLGACSDSFRAFYPTFVMMGAASGMSYLPMLTVVNLFPGSFGFCFTMMGAGASLSLVIPSLLNMIHKAGVPLNVVCWVYAMCGPMVGLLIVLLFVPLDGFIEVDLFVIVRSTRTPRSSVTPREQTMQTLNSFAEGIVSIRGSHSARSSRELPDLALSTVTDDGYFLPFRKEACTFLYFGICLVFIVCSVAIVYYQQTAAIFLAPDAFDALEVASPLSIIPCVVLGRLTDYVLIVYVMMFTNATGVLTFLLATFKNYTASMLSVSFFSLYISLFTSQVFIFTRAVFTSVHFGKLAGFASMVGGVSSLFVDVFSERLSKDKPSSDCRTPLWLLCGVLVAMEVFLVPLSVAARRKQAELSEKKYIVSKRLSGGGAPSAAPSTMKQAGLLPQ